MAGVQATLHAQQLARPEAARLRFTDVLVTNFEKAQGLQREVVVVDLTATESLGFLNQATRICDGLTRCRSGLVVIANVTKLQKLASFDRSQIGTFLKLMMDTGMHKQVLARPVEASFADIMPDTQHRRSELDGHDIGTARLS